MLIITHSHETGTMIEGTVRGDGTAEILKAQRWRWGRSIAAWFVPQSRDRLPKWPTINATAAALRAAGFEVATKIDEATRSTAEVEAGKIERQEQRAGALDSKADRKATVADQAQARADRAHDSLPEGGEPIKVGHHSENRHRNAIEKAHNTQGRAIEAGNDATEAARRAETAQHTTGARYSVQTVANRIKKLEADTRRTQRHITGKRDWITNDAGQSEFSAEPIAATGAYLDRLTILLAEQQDQLTYWLQVRADQIAGGTATNYTRETISKGDFVRHRFGWAEVARVNAKSVSIRTEYSWTDTLEYEAIKEVKTAAEMGSQAAS
ncbi:uncharacterized protein DUF3560 [Rhodoglobus vestalii]|uniref:Uncharacterized protein DUF3560 n=1 Tax=Rhodoglobus vestalii TaxID=193384 RepID=A0A8H2PYE6_9MICO|nr:DUF3560 domain-containing protein [Rhodoglobus vestalii]TQO19658.1 uncharacterized protein DUF3560 [Rhodoglobus vestalii]